MKTTLRLPAAVVAACLALGLAATPAQASEEGKALYRQHCKACHDVDSKRVGPPLTEIVDLYAGDPDGLIAWVKAPGRKRPDYQQMPPITMQEAQYADVATYILDEVFAAPEETESS